jgi:hypothetical protein
MGEETGHNGVKVTTTQGQGQVSPWLSLRDRIGER